MKNKNATIKSYALSLIIDQIIAILITLIITNIIGMFAGGIPALQLILGILIYFLICYIDIWEKGNSDANRVRLGAAKKTLLKGVYAGLGAAIPGFALAIFSFLSETNVIAIYDTFGVDISTTLNRLWYLPFSPLYYYVNSRPILNFLIPFIVPAISGLSYLLGFKGISLKQVFLYKNENSK